MQLVGLEVMLLKEQGVITGVMVYLTPPNLRDLVTCTLAAGPGHVRLSQRRLRSCAKMCPATYMQHCRVQEQGRC